MRQWNEMVTNPGGKKSVFFINQYFTISSWFYKYQSNSLTTLCKSYDANMQSMNELFRIQKRTD